MCVGGGGELASRGKDQDPRRHNVYAGGGVGADFDGSKGEATRYLTTEGWSGGRLWVELGLGLGCGISDLETEHPILTEGPYVDTERWASVAFGFGFEFGSRFDFGRSIVAAGFLIIAQGGSGGK